MTSNSQLNSGSARDCCSFVPPKYGYREEYHEDYHKLIDDGGRGFLNISLLPHLHPQWPTWDEKLEFWLTSRDEILNSNYYPIYTIQWERWQKFRRWQTDQRGDEEDDSRFLEHAKSMQHRLAEHGFTRSFQLSRDPKQQDRLTTWIEYVSFECWSADNLAKQIEDEEPAYEKLFQDKLRRLDIVDHSVTKESLRLPKALHKYKAELKDAIQALDAVRRAIHVDKVDGPDIMNKLSQAHADYDWGCRRDEDIENFLWETRSYYLTTVLLARNVKIVEWAIKEVPMVEAGTETGIEAFMAEHGMK